MAELGRLWKWATWVPELGDNAQQPRPFFLRVKTGLTKLDVAAYAEALDAYWKASTSDSLFALVSPFVEMGDEPLSANGSPVTGLRAYVDLLFTLGSEELRTELGYSVLFFNSVRGTSALFFARLSGGSAFTTEPTGRAAQASR